MNKFSLKEIGKVDQRHDSPELILQKEYLPALDGLKGFSHIIVVWWFDKLDSEEIRNIKVLDKPYKCGPESIGVLATRSPVRPNPIAISVVKVEDLNVDNGVIKIEYIDAEDNSPILDIKPYYPNSDKVKHPIVPEWCSHWPDNVEDSTYFDWDSEMNM